MEELVKIQQELKAPKNQVNKFGGYNYRSCEDILEAVKPLLKKYGCTITLSDDVMSLECVPMVVNVDKQKSVHIGTLPIISSCATIRNKEGEQAQAFGQAGIDVNKAGMDFAQSFGASSSYSRKYALNALLLIDDTKDADATNTHGKEKTVEKIILSEQAHDLLSLISEVKADEKKFLAWAGVDDIYNLPASKFQKAVEMLEAKRKK